MAEPKVFVISECKFKKVRNLLLSLALINSCLNPINPHVFRKTKHFLTNYSQLVRFFMLLVFLTLLDLAEKLLESVHYIIIMKSIF